MRHGCLLPVATIVLAFLFLPSGTAGAGERSSVKRQDPAKALLAAAKNLAKSKNYRVKVLIEGGITENEDHQLPEKTLTETYEGDVFSPLMHVSKMNAFRYPTKGVVLIQGLWRSTMSDKTTVKMERLFTFPEVVLRRALANSSNAKWLEPEKKEAGEAGGDAADAGEDKADASSDQGAGDDEGSAKPEKKKAAAAKKAQKADGKTKAVGKKAVQPKDEGPQPRVVRVEAPPKEALAHFTEIQNSGCLGAG
jgi:hypothetical protein